MHNEKETKKLNAEELEKRVAPASLTYDAGGSTSTDTSTGTKAGGPDAPKSK